MLTTEELLENIEKEKRDKSTLIAVILLFSLACFIHVAFNMIGSFLLYGPAYHMGSFNTFMGIVLRILLPVLSIVLILSKKKEGWLLLIFLSSYNSFQYVFLILRLLLLHAGFLQLIFQAGAVVFLLSAVVLFLLLTGNSTYSLMFSKQRKLYFVAGGAILSLIISLGSFIEIISRS